MEVFVRLPGELRDVVLVKAVSWGMQLSAVYS